ncbi:MAG: hypothetical protein RBQ97_08385 [Acholeplasma sp.]|nr:hypothetical protein [Acholeplasma sp.]
MHNIKESADAKYYKWNIVVILIILGSILLLTLLITLPYVDKIGSDEILKVFLIIGLPFIVIFMLVIIYLVYRYLGVIKYKNYIFYETVLNKPVSFFRAMYFEVEIKCEDGKVKKYDTRAIFYPGFFGPTLLDNYVNKKVIIAINEEIDKAIVVKVIE